VLDFGLESRRNRFGAAIVKAVLLLHSVVACVWMCPIEKAALDSKRAVIRSVSR
jgi:hypothetical protein